MCAMKTRDGEKTAEHKHAGQFSRSACRTEASTRYGNGPTGQDALLREISSLRTRLSKLSEASRRVSENLDINVVLQEVIDNARYLTGARYGALLTFEASGDIQDFITSGLSAEEIGIMGALPQGQGLLGYISETREPLRLADISSHPSSVGFPENHPPMKTFLGMPIRHHGEYVGNIYLTEKERGQEFTVEDQEVLVMFASQAGSAILNARRYRDERKSRADLEALVNISPVGVVVFDARTGDLVSANDETRRLVGKLLPPGRSLADLLTVIALRRPDGSDIPMDEIPTVKALTRGETILADQVVLHPPDGRKAVTALVNARPIRGEDGEIVSVVATLQDITPLEEIKKQRARFLNNVSHELRTPLTAIKGSTATVLSAPHGLDPVETRQFLRVIDEQAGHMHRLINDLVDMTQIEAGSLSISPEPTDLGSMLDEARQAHVALEGTAHSIKVEVAPDLPAVMADRRRILQVLDNLLDSVCRYSPNPSAIKLGALEEDASVAVFVNTVDSGPGSPHGMDGSASTAEGSLRSRSERDDLGLAVCQGIVEAHGGRLTVERGQNSAIRFSFTVPAVVGDVLDDGPEAARASAAPDLESSIARVLVVTDDLETARYIRSTLSEAGLDGVSSCSPDQAERLIVSENPHVVLLEPNFPWDDGFELLKRIDGISDAPVIFIAGHGWDQHIGRAFESGAFDYIAKPFTSTELVARIEVAIQRGGAAIWNQPGPYELGEMVIDYSERTVTVAGSPVRLTATEFKLLVELATSAGRVLTHEQLLRRVWGPLYSSDARIVRTYVKELRRKLGDDAARPKYIFTELGLGYRMPRPSAAE